MCLYCLLPYCAKYRASEIWELSLFETTFKKKSIFLSVVGKFSSIFHVCGLTSISEEFNAIMRLITALSPFSREVLLRECIHKLYIVDFGKFCWEGQIPKNFTSDWSWLLLLLTEVIQTPDVSPDSHSGNTFLNSEEKQRNETVLQKKGQILKHSLNTAS